VTAVDDRPPGRGSQGTPAARSHLARNIAIAVGVVVTALIVVLATRSTDEGINTQIVGRAVPPLTGQTLDGEPYDIDRYRGDWVVVNFFGAWCAECITEHPELRRFDEVHGSGADGVRLVSVVWDDEEEDVRAFFDANGGDWPVVVGDTSRIALDFGVVKLPETYVVAPNGQVVQKLIGGVSQAELDEIIDGYQQAIDDATGEAGR
jgi:cytochrome c biogenesis protein CcmG/thiol:disulfide interchange protein DsbE